MSMAAFERAHFDRHWAVAPALDDTELGRLDAVCALVPPDVGTVLDIGAGNGWFAHRLQEQRPGVRVVGIDFSQAAMARFPGPAVVASSDRVPFAAGAFDLVVSCDCLEHLPDGVFEQTLAEIRRMRPRHVIINTPINELKNGWDRSMCRCPACRAPFHRDHHVRQLTERDYAGLLGTDYEIAADAHAGWNIRFVVRLPRALAARLQWGMRGGLLCPHCGNTDFPDSRVKAVARKALSLFDSAITKPFRSVLTRKSEYAALFTLRSA
jgi:SAM-dependent methyltransferase